MSPNIEISTVVGCRMGCDYCPQKLHVKSYTAKSLLNLDFNNERITIHRLVARTFLPNPENKPEVNHKNGIKDDNRLENLEWCTHAENIKHAYDTGRISRYKKFSESIYRDIKKAKKNGMTFNKICEVFKISKSQAFKIVHQK